MVELARGGFPPTESEVEPWLGLRRRGDGTSGGPDQEDVAQPSLDPLPESCERCARSGRKCPSCVQRRRRAWSLVTERGESIEMAGRALNLKPGRVRELVEEETDRLELRDLRCNSIPVQRTQSVIAEALARNRELTIADMADWLDMRQGDFERAFLGKTRAGRPKRRVTVTNASRLMIALGRAPNELDGC